MCGGQLAALCLQDFVREHYNQHVNLNINSHEARQLREQGEAYPLKAFHNDIKRQLLRRQEECGDSFVHAWRCGGDAPACIEGH